MRFQRTLGLVVALLVGVVGGWFAHDFMRPSPPVEVTEACSLFQSAYDEAKDSADQANEAFDQDEMAHPVRVNEVWKSKHQAALEEAAEIASDAADERPFDWEWRPVALALDEAQRALNPNLSLDYSSVEQQEALQGAVLACLGRT